MATQSACRVCAGDLSLRVVGSNGTAPVAEAFAPSLHETGRHGDLLACVECGTVQQPLLPAGDELHELYRDMRDDAYLGEEAGRRATAAHLLDLIAAQVDGGRLLDVGCGHGLLLDEARSRGYETVGLELSRSAARHAREALGLDVREAPVEDFADDEGFDVVVLADVLEHLDDPVGAVQRCAGLLRAGRRAVRRDAGPLLGDRAPGRPALVGLRARPRVPAAARHPARAARRPRTGRSPPTSRSCAPSRPGAGHRAWPSASGPCASRWSGWPGALPDRASLSLALHDERVVIAHRIEVQHAPAAAAAPPRRPGHRDARAAGLRGHAHDPRRGGRDPRRRRRPGAARRRRQPRRHRAGGARPRASTSSATRTTAATAAARRPATRGRCSTAPT